MSRHLTPPTRSTAPALVALAVLFALALALVHAALVAPTPTHVTCPAYDLIITPHDRASASDVREAVEALKPVCREL